MAISPMTRAGPPGVLHLVFVRATRVLLYLLRISIKAKQNLFIPHWRWKNFTVLSLCKLQRT